MTFEYSVKQIQKHIYFRLTMSMQDLYDPLKMERINTMNETTVGQVIICLSTSFFYPTDRQMQMGTKRGFIQVWMIT
jgi:hypothetical protein